MGGGGGGRGVWGAGLQSMNNTYITFLCSGAVCMIPLPAPKSATLYNFFALSPPLSALLSAPMEPGSRAGGV